MDFHAMPHFGAWKNPSSSPVADWDPAQPHSEDTGEWAHSSCQGKNPADHMGKSWKIYQKPWVFPDFDHSWCSSQNDEWELGDFLQQKCNAHLYVCLDAGWMAVCLYVRPSVRLYVCNVCMVDESGWDANQQEHVDECS